MTLDVSLVPRTHVCAHQEKMGLVNCLFRFCSSCQNAGTMFFSNLMLDVIEDTMCQQYASNMDVDWAITISILEVQNCMVWE